jgi:segregation and condensation protein B
MSETQDTTPQRILEAILFACDAPTPPKRLTELIGAGDVRALRTWVDELNDQYAQTGRAFEIVERAGGYMLLTRPQYGPWLKQMFDSRSESRLSKPALETLAILAYKQPVTRAEIEAIRGVATGEMVRGLMEKGLVRIVGRKDVLGHPLLYGTTRKFLQVFGLASLGDLPKADELIRPADGGQPAQPAEPPAAEAEGAAPAPAPAEPHNVDEFEE